MSEPLDPIETELAAMQPRSPSPDLRRRIGERLAETDRGPVQKAQGKRWTLWVTIAGGALAASVVAAILWPRGGGEVGPSKPPLPDVTKSTLVGGTGSTVLAYQRAFARSIDEFSALVDRDAAAAAERAPQADSVRAFYVSNPEIRAMLGDQ